MDSICPGARDKMGAMNTNQMELSLQAGKLGASSRRKTQRKQRAQWWFNQMRRVVDAAMEWQPSPSHRPEQAYLTFVPKRS
jgi:hypothetical protein